MAHLQISIFIAHAAPSFQQTPSFILYSPPSLSAPADRAVQSLLLSVPSAHRYTTCRFLYTALSLTCRRVVFRLRSRSSTAFRLRPQHHLRATPVAGLSDLSDCPPAPSHPALTNSPGDRLCPRSAGNRRSCPTDPRHLLLLTTGRVLSASRQSLRSPPRRTSMPIPSK